VPVQVEAGTPMEKQIPLSLVEPYLTGERSVLAGFAYRAVDALFADPDWPAETHGRPSAGGGPAVGGPDFWVLRWHALEMQSFLAPHPAAHTETGRGAYELLVEPGPIPVGTEMFRITQGSEEFIARYDGQDWLRPAPEA
jgi:hypothetical protein